MGDTIKLADVAGLPQIVFQDSAVAYLCSHAGFEKSERMSRAAISYVNLY
jgi:hypothetical protein